MVPRDRLVDVLWGESSPPTAVTALHGHISRLRRLLGDSRIETRPPGYRLLINPGELDLQVFRDLLAENRHEEALALWRGPVPADLALDDIAGAEIARLDELRLAALEQHFEHELAAGRHAALAPKAAAAVRANPLRERIVGQLMTALYRSGRQAEALDVYRDTRTTLDRELGLQPGDDLRELQRRILAHDRALDLVRGGPRAELPTQLTSFVGRGRELIQVLALIARPGVRLLTLTGAGGTGKTRLALEATRSAARDFADGVCFVPLASLTQPELVPNAIAQALGLDQSRGQPIVDALKAHFVDRELLLVLDNLEHLLEATPLATELLAAAPGLMILATSRTHLSLYGETEYAVPPLSARDEAVALFAERAAAVRPDFAVTDVVADICARVDGLPLAVELAAAQVRTLTLPEILARLDHRLELLTDGPRDVPARQRTLRDTLVWSYDLLSPAEQRLFSRLAVFAGGWPVAAVREVYGHDLLMSTEAGLRSLAEKNLVLRDAEERFGMLETIRELARERLAAGGEEGTIREAHARWCLMTVEAGGPNRRGAQRSAWLDQVGRERENVRAALRWAAESGHGQSGLRLAAGLAPFWIAHGLIDEGKRSLAAVLAASHEPSRGRARALAAAGIIRMLDDDAEAGERACRESLELSTDGDDWYRAVALNVLGTGARYRSEWARARRLYRQALTLAATADLWWPAALAQANLGELETLELHHREALEHHLQAVAMAREGADAWMVAICLTNAGRAARRLGELDRATALQTQALRDFVSLDNAWGIAVCVDAFAALAVDLGDHLRAAQLYGAAETIRQRARIAIWPTIRAEREAGIATAMAALGEPGWTHEHARGRALTLDQATAEAYSLAALASHTRVRTLL